MICDLGANPLAKDAVHLCTSSVSTTCGLKLLHQVQKETSLHYAYLSCLLRGARSRARLSSLRGASPRETLTDPRLLYDAACVFSRQLCTLGDRSSHPEVPFCRCTPLYGHRQPCRVCRTIEWIQGAEVEEVLGSNTHDLTKSSPPGS